MSDPAEELRRELEAARRTIAELRQQVVDRESGQRQSEQELEESRSTLLSVVEEMEMVRRQIEQAHQEWMSALDTVSDPIFLHDNEFRILRANRAYQRCAGIPFKEIIGRPYYEIFPKMKGPLPGCLHALEEMKECDDEIVIGDLVYRVRAYPVHGEHGEFLFSVHSFEDVTERKGMLMSLKATNALLRSVVENIPARIFWKDRDLRYLGCNTLFAKDAGRTSPDELTGKTDFEMAWKDQAELYRADDRAVMESGHPKLDYEEPQTTPDGSTIWLSTSKVPLRDESNQVIGMLGIYQDITEHKQAESDLAEQLKELRRWHDSTLGREGRVLELKHEVNDLLNQTGKHSRYPSAESPDSKEE